MMTRRTTLMLTAALALVLLWLMAGHRVGDQRHDAATPERELPSSSAGVGGSGSDRYAETSNGKIAFMRHSDIYVMNSDGTGRSNLTSTKMS